MRNRIALALLAGLSLFTLCGAVSASQVQPAPLSRADRAADCFGRCGVTCLDEPFTGDFYTPECEAHDACVRSMLRGGASQLTAHPHCRHEAGGAARSW